MIIPPINVIWGKRHTGTYQLSGMIIQYIRLLYIGVYGYTFWVASTQFGHSATTQNNINHLNSSSMHYKLQHGYKRAATTGDIMIALPMSLPVK